MNSDQGGEPLQEEAEPGLKSRGEAELGPRAREEVGAAESGSMVSQGLTFYFSNHSTSSSLYLTEPSLPPNDT